MKKLDVIDKFKDSSIVGDFRKELINFSISNGFFDDVFMFLSVDEKKDYVFDLSFDRIKDYLSGFDSYELFLFVSFCINEKKFGISGLFGLCELLDDSYKLEVIKLYDKCFSSYYYDKIIASIKDEDVSISLINYLFDINYSIHVISGIISDLSVDSDKEIFLDRIPINNRVKVLETFNDKNLVKKYVFDSDYSNYKSNLIVITGDREFIKKQFVASDSSIFRKNILSKISDKDFKYELINCVNDSDLSYFYGSNFGCYADRYLSEVDDDRIRDACISDEITIGVEMELYNKNINYYKGMDTVFGDYKIVKDSTLRCGIEIVSPVIGFNKDDLQRLKSLCEVVKSCGFYTDKTCGGHIHIGANYLRKKEDFLMLIYLYCNCEDIIYSITDRENTNKRKDALVYAKKVKDVFAKGIFDGFISDEMSFDRFTEGLKYLTNSRYVGLNFSNLGNVDKNTIEFRMPNGEMDFEEIMANIKLVAKLVQKSHDLNNCYGMDKEIELLGCNIGDKMRLDILLDILFDKEEEKKIYRRRYKANNKLISSIHKKVFGGGCGIRMDVKERKLVRG